MRNAAAPAFAPWRVESRRLLAVTKGTGLVCHVSLVPLDGRLPDWQAGDEVETLPIAVRRVAARPDDTFRQGLAVESYAAAALLPRGHPVDFSKTRREGHASRWPIASLRRENTLDLILVADPSADRFAEIPQHLLTGMEIDLRVVSRPWFHLQRGRRILVADMFGLATARTWLAEAASDPKSELVVLLVCPAELAAAALGDGILDRVQPGRLEVLPVESGSREFARALERASTALPGFLDHGVPVSIIGQPEITEPAWQAVCAMTVGRHPQIAAPQVTAGHPAA